MRDYREILPYVERGTVVNRHFGQAGNLAVSGIEAERNFLAENRNTPGGAGNIARGGCPGSQVFGSIDVGGGANINNRIGLGDVGRKVRHKQGQLGEVGGCFEKGIGVCGASIRLDRISQRIKHVRPGFRLGPTVIRCQLGNVVLEVVLAEQHTENISGNPGTRISCDGNVAPGDTAVHVNPGAGFSVPCHLPIKAIGIQSDISGIGTGGMASIQLCIFTNDDLSLAEIGRQPWIGLTLNTILQLIQSLRFGILVTEGAADITQRIEGNIARTASTGSAGDDPSIVTERNRRRLDGDIATILVILTDSADQRVTIQFQRLARSNLHLRTRVVGH